MGTYLRQQDRFSSKPQDDSGSSPSVVTDTTGRSTTARRFTLGILMDLACAKEGGQQASHDDKLPNQQGASINTAPEVTLRGPKAVGFATEGQEDHEAVAAPSTLAQTHTW
jgi:hypothetical protein